MTGYPLGRPDLNGREEEYVLQTLRENIISSVGRHVGEFERAFAALHQVPWAVAVSNGTAALHLALHALGLGPGGDAGCFSFYGNKIVTTGEVSMVIAAPTRLDQRLRHLRDHAMSAEHRYYHDEVGFNCRLTALQAAIGLAQVERLGSFVEERGKIEAGYRRELSGARGVVFRQGPAGSEPVCWQFTCRIEGCTRKRRDWIIERFRGQDVDSRPALRPMRSLPMYSGPTLPNAQRISDEGINLPTFVGLREPDVSAICGILRRLI